MTSITIIKRDHNGISKFEYQGEVVERGATWVCIRAPFQGEYKDLGVVVFQPGDWFTEWHFVNIVLPALLPVAISLAVWFFPLPALLGVIFGFVGRGQIKRTNAKGGGMAIAGIVVGIIFVAIGIALWAYIKSFDYCIRDGGSYTCYNR